MLRTGKISVWVASIMLLTVVADFSLAQEDPSAAVFADWAKRQKAYKSIRIQAEGTVMFTPALLNRSETEIYHKEAITKPESFTLLIDCETGRARFDLKTSLPSGERRIPKTFNRSFAIQQDQAIVKFQRAENAIPGDDSDRDRPDLSFMKLEQCEFPLPDVLPVLWSLGRIPLPNRDHRGRKFWVDIEYNASLFDSIVTESPTLLRLKSTQLNPANRSVYHEISVNPKLQYAITNFKMHGGLTREYQLKYDLKDHPRLPSEWSYSFTNQNKLWRAHKQKVTSVEMNPKVIDSDFDFPLEPGLLVSTLENKLQRVASNGSLVDLVGEEAAREQKSRALAKQITDRHPELRSAEETKSNNSSFLIVGLTLSGILVLTGILIVFRRRNVS